MGDLSFDAVIWLVLDNVTHGWNYRTNCDWDAADKAYRHCIESGFIKDGRITDEGRGWLLVNRIPSKYPCTPD